MASFVLWRVLLVNWNIGQPTTTSCSLLLANVVKQDEASPLFVKGGFVVGERWLQKGEEGGWETSFQVAVVVNSRLEIYSIYQQLELEDGKGGRERDGEHKKQRNWKRLAQHQTHL